MRAPDAESVPTPRGSRSGGLRRQGAPFVAGPRVLEHGGAHGLGEVEAARGGVAAVERGEDAEGLRVALEAVRQAEPAAGDAVEHLLAEVAERRVAEVVRSGGGLNDDGVASAEVGDDLADVSDASRKPTAIERATAETLSEWVSRLCTMVPEPACGIT